MKKTYTNEAHGARLMAYESAADLARHAKALKAVNGNSGWTGQSGDEVLRGAINGDDRLVPKAQALLDKVDTAGIELVRPEWRIDVAGAFPDVGAYMAGAPQTMRRKFADRTEKSTVRIFIDLTTSGGVSHKSIATRGTAILAMAMLLSQQRPVEIHAIIALGRGGALASIATVQIPAAPLELATACNALTSAGFARTLGYGVLMHRDGCNSGGGWAWGDYPDGEARQRYEEKMRDVLKLQKQDAFFPPINMQDEESDMCRKPVEWVNATLKQFGAVVDREAA